MDELISVVINIYNGEKYVKKCLQSIVNQTYKNLEIIIVDDGSTDNTVQLCKGFNDERIRIIGQKHGGLSKARNTGIENANGNYIYFIDIDDFIDVDTIEYLYGLCKKYDVMISTCRPIDIFDYNFKPMTKNENMHNKDENIAIISKEEMLKKILLTIDRSNPIWNKLIKKEVFNNIRFDENLIDDATAVTYKIILNVDRIAYSNEIKYYYFNNIEGMSKQRNPYLIIDEYMIFIERYKDLKKIYPDFIENEICVLSFIAKAHFIGNEMVQDFLKEQESIKLFNRLFSLKILIYNMNFREKVKILLFRINPKLFKKCVNLYLRLKGKDVYEKQKSIN